MSADSPDLDPPDHPVDGPATIFVSDPSAEADRLSTALREKNYTVIDVPLSLLVARVAVQTPMVILLDVDAEGALDEVARLREIPGGEAIHIIFLGDRGSTPAERSRALADDGSGFLSRPVDVEALLRKIGSLIGAQPADSSPAAGSPSVRPGVMPSERSSPSSGRARRTPPPEPWPDRPPALADAADALEPSFGGGMASASKLPLPALSPEIEQLLQGAEERAHELGPPSQLPASEPPSPDEEVDAVLPAEVLAALDEPLDENDDDLQSDGGSGTSAPKMGGTGERSATPNASHVGSHPDEKSSAAAGRAAGGSDSLTPPSAPLSHPVERGDPKEMETPRPPRRSPLSSSPPPKVPRSSALPRDLLPSSSPPLRATTIAGMSTVPPGPSRSRSPIPPATIVARGPPVIDVRSPRSTSPPQGSTVPPALSFEPHMVPENPLPSTPRAAGLSRRSESLPPESFRDGGAGVAPADLPEELGLGDALQAFAICVRERATGALCIDVPDGVRRMLLRDGDVVTAASGIDDESLVAFLGSRGDIPPEVAMQLHGKIPAFGRHAGAALVANGHISQDQLWPVLRAHAEWILACAIGAESGGASFEVSPPGRLRAEPSVFGGATGSEVLIEVVRRSVPAESALSRLGGGQARIVEGPRWDLLSECALPEVEQDWLRRSKGSSIEDAIATARNTDLVPMLYALVQLGVLIVDAAELRSAKRRPGRAATFDTIDAQALRSQVKARLNLVEEGDYFSLLGVPRNATSYEIHRAYLELRRGLEPSRVLNPITADLADDIELIMEVVEEAHEILRDQARRERYRRAIEDKPPA